MIDRQDEGSAIGSELLGSSDRLFHWWHKYRDGEMAWSTFLGYARPIRWGVRQALGRGASCASEKTAATCRMLLEGEEHLWTFLRVPGIEPTNNAAERALRHAVLWRKSSGGTASEWGSRFVERVLSVAATCRQQGRNVLEFLTECFRAHQYGRRPSFAPVRADWVPALRLPRLVITLSCSTERVGLHITESLHVRRVMCSVEVSLCHLAPLRSPHLSLEVDAHPLALPLPSREQVGAPLGAEARPLRACPRVGPSYGGTLTSART